MNAFLIEIGNTALALTAILALLGAIGTFAYRWILKPMRKRLAEKFKKWASEFLADVLKPQFDSLQEVKKKVMPNSGSSIPDAITELRTEVQKIAERQRIQGLEIPKGQFETDLSGQWIDCCNRTLQKMFNQNEDDLLAFNWLSSIEVSSQDEVWANYQACIQQQREFDMLVPLTRGITLRMVARPIWNVKGEFDGLMGMTVEAKGEMSSGPAVATEMKKELKRKTQVLLDKKNGIETEEDGDIPV